MDKYTSVANGEMVPANATDLVKDRIGFTNPNLHRRIDSETPEKYHIGVHDNMHSYRTVDTGGHDEESTTCEIP